MNEKKWAVAVIKVRIPEDWSATVAENVTVIGGDAK